MRPQQRSQGYGQNKYQRDLVAMQARAQQPPRGNYRVDAEGRPLMSPQDVQETRWIPRPPWPKTHAQAQGNLRKGERGANAQRRDWMEPTASEWEEAFPGMVPEVMAQDRRTFNQTDYRHRQSILQRRQAQPTRYPKGGPSPSPYPRQGPVRLGNHRTAGSLPADLPWSRTGPSHRPSGMRPGGRTPRPITAGQKVLRWVMNDIHRLPDNRLQLFAFFLCLLVFYLYNGWLLLPFQMVNSIMVSGNNYIDTQAIVTSSRITDLDQYKTVKAQEKAIEKKMKEELPILESLKINRPSYKEVELKVTEYDIVALMNVNNTVRPVMANGELIMDDNVEIDKGQLANQLPELLGFNQKGKIIDLTNNALRTIPNDLLEKMKTITLSTDPAKPNTILVQMKDGNRVQAIINTFSDKIAYYNQILDQLKGKKGVINLEVGAYFTPD